MMVGSRSKGEKGNQPPGRNHQRPLKQSAGDRAEAGGGAIGAKSERHLMEEKKSGPIPEGPRWEER